MAIINNDTHLKTAQQVSLLTPFRYTPKEDETGQPKDMTWVDMEIQVHQNLASKGGGSYSETDLCLAMHCNFLI